MLRRVSSLFIISFFVSFCFSEDSSRTTQDSLKQVVEESVIEIEASNIRKEKNQYLIDIYANNMNKNIAGIQFNLIGEDFTILEASGGLAEKAGFNFYNGSKGVILAFSLEGKTISNPKKRAALFTLKVQKNNKKPSEFNIKTLIAGERGVKLESIFSSIVID